jgi:predicted PurR-regulated permease PerM
MNDSAKPQSGRSPTPGRLSIPGPSPRTRQWASLATIGLFVLACFYTLHVAQAILMPITAALILWVLLTPLMRVLARIRLPAPAAAAFVIFSVFAGVVLGVYVLSEPAATWIAEMPKTARQIERKFRPLKDPIEDVRKATEQMERITDLGAPSSPPQKVVVENGGLFDRTLDELVGVGSTLGIIFALLYFLLSSGDLFLQKLLRVLPSKRARSRALEMTEDIGRNLSTYLSTITLINIALGIATGLAMYVLKLPNPVLWGALAAVLNFIPYVGVIIGTAVILLVGMVTFDTLWQALLPSAVYLGLHLIESQLITPHVLGRRLTMNPVVVFLAVIIWGELWGIPGSLMAVPLLAALKVVCDTVDGLAPIGEFIGGRTQGHPLGVSSWLVSRDPVAGTGEGEAPAGGGDEGGGQVRQR